MNRGAAVLLIVVMLLVLTAGALLTRSEARPAGEFHRLTGGLGFGPAVSLAGCEFDFDPRLCPACPEDHGPIPGGAAFCPHHGCSILEHVPLGAGN